MLAANFLLLGAVLFCIGVFGVLARRNAVMVLMSVELCSLTVQRDDGTQFRQMFLVGTSYIPAPSDGTGPAVTPPAGTPPGQETPGART